jgi:Amt family ammonium transporter
MRSSRVILLAVPALLGLPALAQVPTSTPSTQAQIAALQQAVQNAQSNADNAWMLVSAALVLLMTGPGLALFYGGLVRRKNILGTMMQSFAMMGLVTILWAIAGYSLAFGHGTSFIGGLEHVFLRGVGLAPNPDYAPTIPEQTYMIYQLMFAIITPALITGAFAERMKFSAMAVFLSLWSLFVYCPMAHMVWGVGGLLNASGGHIPSLDFAGGTVVHITSGVSALVTALYLGKRMGYPHTAMPPHSMVLSFIGACLLWVGWFGFNAGSALNSGPLATSAFVNTHFAAAAAAFGWVLAEWIHNGKPTALGAISGAVAGLVAITPASGFVQPFSALLIGVLAGVFCSFMVFEVKSRLGYDDSLDAFGVHGAGGTVGALLTGLFATKAINAAFGQGVPTGAMDGHWHQLLNQAAGVAI